MWFMAKTQVEADLVKICSKICSSVPKLAMKNIQLRTLRVEHLLRYIEVFSVSYELFGLHMG